MMIDKETGEILETGQRAAVASLATYYDARESKQAGEAAMANAATLIKQWLTDHPGETLRDGEHGLVGSLQNRSAAPWLDVESLARDHPDLLIEAAQRGLLGLRAGVWQGIKKMPSGFVDKFAGFIHPSEGTPALMVRKDE